MPTLKGTEASLSYVQSFLYLVTSSINVSIFHSMWVDTFWIDLIFCNSERRRGNKNIKYHLFLVLPPVLLYLPNKNCRKYVEGGLLVIFPFLLK